MAEGIRTRGLHRPSAGIVGRFSEQEHMMHSLRILMGWILPDIDEALKEKLKLIINAALLMSCSTGK